MTLSTLSPWLRLLAALALAPLLPAITWKVKAAIAGRKGAPLLQNYFDIVKLFRKDTVQSRTTTLFLGLGSFGPLLLLLCALSIVPLWGFGGALHFQGDWLLMAALLSAARFLLMMSAMDTGGAFEGMGSSREAQFSFFTEPALILSFSALSRFANNGSLSEALKSLSFSHWSEAGPMLALLAASLALLFLSENKRVPFDNPDTHLELTMIHEAMVLDHSGPDLGAVQLTSLLRFLLFTAILGSLLLPWRSGSPLLNATLFLLSSFILSAGVGLVESVIARLRFLKIPGLLMAAIGFALLALLMAGRNG